jgi:hypothetical protein
LELRLDHVIGAVIRVKSMAFGPSRARAVLGMSPSKPRQPEHSESRENIDKINIPREELEDVMLAELQRTVVGADVREIAIFGASALCRQACLYRGLAGADRDQRPWRVARQEAPTAPAIMDIRADPISFSERP